MYNFNEALIRIEERLDTVVDNKVSPTIPTLEELSDFYMGKVYGTVLSIRYSITGKTTENLSPMESIAVSCFVAESREILRNNTSCRDIIIEDGHIICVFNSSLKKEMDLIINDAARIRTLAMVIEKKYVLRHNSIIVKQGLCYGELQMSLIESNDRKYRQILWYGEAQNQAISLSKNDNCNDILISRSIWKNLSENNRKFFTLTGPFDDTYNGNIVNVNMNNWLTSK